MPRNDLKKAFLSAWMSTDSRLIRGKGNIMSQGSRNSWVRSVFAGLGMALCVAVFGCNSTDKPKPDPLGTKPVGTGLPGTPTLPGSASTTSMPRPTTQTTYPGPSTGYPGSSSPFTGSSTNSTGTPNAYPGSSGTTGTTGTFGSANSATGGVPNYSSTGRPTTPTTPYSTPQMG